MFISVFLLNHVAFSQLNPSWYLGYDVVNPYQYDVIASHIGKCCKVIPTNSSTYTFEYNLNGGSIQAVPSKAIGFNFSIIIHNETDDVRVSNIVWNRIIASQTVRSIFLQKNKEYSVYVDISSFGVLGHCDDIVANMRWSNSSGQVLSSHSVNLKLNNYVSKEWTYQNRLNRVNNSDVFMRDWKSPYTYLRGWKHDLGAEPHWDWWEPEFWPITESPDIWVRKYADNIWKHQNPQFATLPNNSNKVYYRIYNPSCQVSEPVNLRLYWTLARTDEDWDHDWVYSASNQIDGNTAGSEISISDIYDYSSSSSPISIPALNPDEIFVAHHDWIAPNPNIYPNAPQHSKTGQPVICLLARIESNWDNMYLEMKPHRIFENVYRNNNIVTRNTWLATSEAGYYVGPLGTNFYSDLASFYVNNLESVSRDICITIKDYSDTNQLSLTQFANVYLYFENPILNEFLNQNITGTGFQIVDNCKIQIMDLNNFMIDNISLSPGAMSNVAIQFEYFSPAPDSDLIYTFQIGETDTSTNTFKGTPIGFITDILKVPTAEFAQFPQENSGQISLGFIENVVEKIDLFPNPTENEFNLSFELYKNEQVVIKVIDIFGKICYKHQQTEYNSGKNMVLVNTELLKQGVYFVELSVNDTKTCKKFTKL